MKSGQADIRNNGRSAKGFTLVELMMAMAVAGIFVAAMVLSFQKLMGGSLITRQRTVAGNLAQERLEELKNYAYHRLIPTTAAALLNPTDSSNPYPSETIPAQGVTFTRATVIRKANVSGTTLTLLSPDANDPGLKSITITVSWVEGSETKSVSMGSLLEDPNRAPLDSQIYGTVTTAMLAPVESVWVYVISNPNWSCATNALGQYTLQVANGTYQVAATNDAYITQTSSNLVLLNQTLANNFTSYTLRQTGMASGYVFLRQKVVISEVCSRISADSNEYVELYNPTSSTITLNASTICLSAVDSSNNLSAMNMSFINTLIAPNGYYLISRANPVVVLGITYSADATWLNINKLNSSGGGVILSDATTGVHIDKVAWDGSGAPSKGVEGAGVDVSGSLADACIERRPYYAVASPSANGNAYDRDWNATDFVKHAALNPQNTSSAAEVPTGGTAVQTCIVWVDDGLSSTVTTNTLGAYSDTNVASGTWNISATGGASMTSLTMFAQYPSLAVTNNASVTQDIVLTGGGAYAYIVGNVKTGGSTALNNILMRSSTSQTRTNIYGNYYLPLAVGEYNIVGNYNYDNLNYNQTTYSPSITLTAAGQVVEDVDFDLSGAGSVTGTVTINGTDPIPNVRVAALNSLSQEVGSALSNASGIYLISGLPTTGNNYTIYPTLDPMETSVPSTTLVTVVSGSTLTNRNFQVSNALVTITGSVKSNGSPITTGVLVIATTGTISGDPPTINSTVRGGATIYYTGTSDSEGVYTLRVRGAASPGTTYNVYAWHSVISSSGTVTTTKKSGTKAAIVGTSPSLDFTTF